jgi:uncharacterized protein YjbI with pentapeptide repeats
MNTDVILGWILGFVSSVASGIVVFILQSRRDSQLERMSQKREDIRTVTNWAKTGRIVSLRGFDLEGANLSGVDLASADLEDTNFTKTRLYGTDLHGSKLILSEFRKAKLVGVNLRGANLTAADFNGAILRGVDFTGANLLKARFRNIKIEAPCIWASVKIDDSAEMDHNIRNLIQTAFESTVNNNNS